MGVRLQSGMLKSCRAECGVTQKCESTRENDRKKEGNSKERNIKDGEKDKI